MSLISVTSLFGKALIRLHLYFVFLAGGVSIGNVLPATDIAQFKQGVKSVAGKMAVLANGVMNSLQVRSEGKVVILIYYLDQDDVHWTLFSLFYFVTA